MLFHLPSHRWTLVFFLFQTFVRVISDDFLLHFVSDKHNLPDRVEILEQIQPDNQNNGLSRPTFSRLSDDAIGLK